MRRKMSIKKILKNLLGSKTHIKTFQQHIPNEIGTIKDDLIITAFLFERKLRGRAWPEVEIYKPEFKPFWDHEYELKRYIDALEGQLRARALEYYYGGYIYKKQDTNIL